MSGGTMDYLYRKIQAAEFPQDTPERIAFAAHLHLVAEALRAIEWVDSGDLSPGAESRLIELCLRGTARPAQ
jgi:hypothetical protein